MLQHLQLLRRWWWIPATLLLVVAGLTIGQLLAPPKPLTIFLHPGGKLTLNSKDGREITVEEIRMWERSEIPEQPIILDTPPGATLDAWDRPLVFLAELGPAFYQIRLGKQTYNFHIPYASAPERGEGALPPEIIDLRKRKDAPDPTEQDNYDVQVLTDRSTTWDEVFQHTTHHRIPGVSMMIDTDGEAFLRDRNEDDRHRSRERRQTWSP